MNIELQANLEPAKWPENKMQDVILHLNLINTANQPVTLYPTYTALAWKISVASMGMSWIIDFVPTAPHKASASGHELRTYYGPPGEPVSAEAVKKAAWVLKPGQEKRTTLHACWVPRVLLNPANLDLKMLDPQGLDNLKAVQKLDQSSVLVFNVSSQDLKKQMGTKDFLRGYMVVFYSGPGKYLLLTQYRQEPSRCVLVEKLTAIAKPVELVVGEGTYV